MVETPRWVMVGLPLLLGVVLLALWQALVTALAVPVFVLPSPAQIWTAFWQDRAVLLASLWATLRITVAAFLLALASGVFLAALSAQSRLIRISIAPYAVALQVTPLVAIAPMVLIWVGITHLDRALLILAAIVAFFPIYANTTLGLSSADHNLRDLFRLYGATRWQRLIRLQAPTALPFLLTGMRISGGLALIGAVVAEFVAGSGTGTGLAWRILDSANRLNIPRMFAALLLLSALGVAIHFAIGLLQHILLRRWHDSAVPGES